MMAEHGWRAIEGWEPSPELRKAIDIVGWPAIERLMLAGYAVAPFNVPDYAVGEVMSWTGCKSPDMAWEAINCALNWMGIELPGNVADLTALANGALPPPPEAADG